MNTAKYAELYAAHYDKLFKKLSKPLQERVLACKADETKHDTDVNTFIQQVILTAEVEEAKLEAKENEALAAANAQLQLNEKKGVS